MIRALLAALFVVLLSSLVFAEPTVLVLPFDPIIDSVYGYYGGKESILDYRHALEEMLVTELGKHEEIWVVEPSRLESALKEKKLQPKRWNDPTLASELASSLNADYVIIGTYGEFSKEIRVDARVVIAATGEVPPGNTVTSTVGLWNDLPTSATRIAAGVVPIVTASGRLRPTSKGRLFPEGDLSAYDPNRTAPRDHARLVVWVNAPAPQITAEPTAIFARCDRIDIMNIPPEKQRTSACQMAVLPSGAIHLRINHRGFLPYEDYLTLAPGKAYRLEVSLKPIETQLPK